MRSIHILGFRLLPDEERFAHYHHVFELLERNLHHRLTDHLEIHLIEMPKFSTEVADLSTAAAKWFYYLQNGDQMSTAQVHALGVEEIDMADKELLTISQSRRMRVLYEQRLRDDMDKRSLQKDWVNEGQRLGTASPSPFFMASGSSGPCDSAWPGSPAWWSSIIDRCR